MNYKCAKLRLISLIFALIVRHCWFVSAVRMNKTPEQLALPRVTCSSRGIRAVFGPLVKSSVRVKDVVGATIPVSRSEEGSCGVGLRAEKNRSLTVLISYDSCYALIEGSRVVVPLQVQLTGQGGWFRVNVSCPLIKRRTERTRLTLTPSPVNCAVERALRVDCGRQSISRDACYNLGCCFDAYNLTCYYRLNACSLDGHFVFAVKAADTEPPIDPSSLIVKDQPWCSPVVTTPDTAVFKIGVMDCDAKKKVDGDVVIYEVEVEELHTKSLAKQSPFSLQVPCEFKASELKRAADLRSLYAVTNPPPVVMLGTIRVQMRIAKDASFTSFFPEDQLPLTLPLRKAAYVEISIAPPSPDSTLSLRVRDCFAYPASRHSVWTLLYDGCPNPFDTMRSSVPVDHQGRTTSHSQVRRFDVKTFAFLDPHTGHPSVEEMYFYCWVEICANDHECAQHCSILSPEGNRRRREATTAADQVRLVSLGPLLPGQNDTGLEDDPCVKQNAAFQATVYVLSGVGAALLLILLFTVCSHVMKWQKPEAQVDSEPSQ